MCFVNLLSTLMLPLIGMQVQQAAGCTFTPYQGEFAGRVKYEILKRSEEECLQTCYEEFDCTFAQFVQLLTGVCTIYTNGPETQNVTGAVYNIDRQLIIPNCQQPLSVAPKVEFPKNISEVVVHQNEAELDRLFDQNVTAIYKFRYAGRGFFSRNTSLFPNGTKPYYKLLFSRVPQPDCLSLPVFTTASGRIYMGNVYNVTGYTFMHAYAFADVCRRYVCAGNCCGRVSVYSTKYGNLLMEDGNRPIYVADVIEFSTGRPYYSNNYRAYC